ncbi:MAG: UDP-N-acetylmuramoyl-L-alanine--D-glutamate ligase [bacterium]
MRTRENYHGKKVLVIGLARSGLAVANLLTTHGARVTVIDEKSKRELISNIKKLKKGIKILVGRQNSVRLKNLISKYDLLVISPGVPRENPLVEKARKLKIPVVSEVEAAFNIASSNLDWRTLPSPPVVAVTGTNGKTTTCELIGAVLRSEKRRKVIVAGNIGTPLSSVVGRINKRTVLVLEISSFQLENIESFHPYVAVILNITPDHMDRHKTMSKYIQAKANIFKKQTEEDFCILNRDDKRCRILEGKTKSQVVFFSSKRALGKGVFVKGRRIVSNLDSRMKAPPDKGELLVEHVKVPGPHNLENALVVVAVGNIFGISKSKIRKAIEAFPGIEHRLEIVREIDGRRFINDSKATNVDACKRALETFPAPIILIMGGYDKGTPYRPLADLIREKVTALVLLGEAAPRIEKELIGSAAIYRVDGMREGVELSYSLSQPGSSILLSPACSSFDMYSDFEERGKDFKRWVRET